jgi:serpin B
MSLIIFSKLRRKFLFAFFLALASRQVAVAGSLDDDKLVSANVGFAFDLMRQVVQAQPDANVFISPFSVSSVLQMTGNGAAGVTKTEMQQVLKTVGMSSGSLNAAFKDLDQQFAACKDVTLNLANGLWFQQGFHLKPAFVGDNQKYFQAELAGVDFDRPQSAKTINTWADRQTKGKIKEIVQYPFPPLTRLILANAIYFKGNWVTPFKKNLTGPRDFHLVNGQSKQTPMMVQGGHFVYQETSDFQAVKLPYQGGLQMELFLPATNSSPQKLVADFAAKENWQKNIETGFSDREGFVTLPKFKMEYAVKLNETLKALGMKSAFAGNADFSGIAAEPLFIGEVKQKSFVDVYETGTEAAAVTTVTMLGKAASMPRPDLFRMILDRPFFFVISDMASGSILFMGIVNDPTSGN